MLDQVSEHIKTAIDAVAAGVTFATLANLLPYISATLTVIWMLIRLYDRIKYGPNVKE